MVGGPNTGGLIYWRLFTLALVASSCLPAPAQTRLTLQRLNDRKAPGYTSTHQGETVLIRGVVSQPAYHYPAYTVLAIQDEDGGAILDTREPDTRLEAFQPGDEIEVVGKVATVAGMIIVQPETIVVLDRKAPPVATALSVGEIRSLANLGRLMSTESRVVFIEDSTAGANITLAAPIEPYHAFIPRRSDQPMPAFGFAIGDSVRVTGVTYQYQPSAPYNRGFELLVNSPSQIVKIDRVGWFMPSLVAAGLCVVLSTGFFLWSRERRLRGQRERLRDTYHLGEEILGASSAEAILKRIAEALPAILGVTRVHLYVYNRAAKTLEGVVEQTGEPVSISISSPPSGTHSGAVACFHYRTLLAVPDIDRSPFPIASNDGEHAPKSLLFVAMMAQGEVIGVMELDQDDRVRDFDADEQALAQHLGNQIGVAIRLLDQRSVQEQLFRTEKLAAVGRLISGVINELQTPLSSISKLANIALEREHVGAAEHEVSAIASEAQKASSMVARLVSFAADEKLEARPVSMSGLLRNLIDFREGDCKASGIRIHDLISSESLFVMGSQGQLEQVFLNLLVHAEQTLAESPQKSITIRTSLLARRLLVEISFSAPPELRKPEETAGVLGVTRSVIAGHGGEVRLIEKNNADPRFEVELPVSSKDRGGNAAAVLTGGSRDSGRQMIALVIEPDEAAQRLMLGLLATRGYRVVPVANADTGLELAHRLRFDAAFCSVHAPGLNWVELSERMQSRVACFVLVSDGYNAELSADFEDDGRFVLPKPVQESELDRVLRRLEAVPQTKVVNIRSAS